MPAVSTSRRPGGLRRGESWRYPLAYIRSSRRARQFDPKPAPRSVRGFHPRAAAHALGALAHDRKPEARAGIGLDAVQPLEDPEDALLILRGDADSVVLDAQAYAVLVAFAAHMDARLDVRSDELDRVREQIDDHLHECRAVREPNGQRLGDRDMRAAAPSVVGDLSQRIVNGGVERHWRYHDALAAEPAIREQIKDEPIHVLGRSADMFGIFFAYLVEPIAEVLQQRLAKPAHHAQRRAQVVRDRIGERLHLLVGLAELGGALGDPVLELRLRLSEFRVDSLLLGDIAGDFQDSARCPVFVALKRPAAHDIDDGPRTLLMAELAFPASLRE